MEGLDLSGGRELLSAGEVATTTHPVVPLGFFLLAAAVLGLILYHLKQSVIIACIATGMLGRIIYDDIYTSLPTTLTHVLYELGIMFVLFCAGMEVDVPGFIKTWKVVCVQGLGQIGITLAVSAALGVAFFDLSDVAAIFFFGLCMTLSSTIVVLGTVIRRGEMGKPHGQIILGIMVFQDIVAVVGISVVEALNPAKDSDVGIEIGLIFAKLIALLIILAIVRFTFLTPWFEVLSRHNDLMFIGSLGYSLGVAGFCYLANFSGEMGCFWVGVTVASLPFRLELEQKVEGIKILGVSLFFILLGFELEYTLDDLGEAIPWAVLFAFLLCIVFPLFMSPLGAISKIPAKDSAMIGYTINQISEFSLVIAKKAFAYQVLEKKIFLIVAFGTLISIFFSSLMHIKLDLVAKLVRPIFKCQDKCAREQDEKEEHHYSDHILLLGYSEFALELKDKFEGKKKVLLLTFNHDVVNAFNPPKPKKKKNQVYSVSAETEGKDDGHGHDHKFEVMYGNYQDPHVLEHAGITSAALVVSCDSHNSMLALELAKRLKGVVPYVTINHDYREPEKLYAAGADFCLQTEHFSAKKFGEIFQAEIKKGKDAFKQIGEAHSAKLVEFEKRVGKVLFGAA